MPLVHISFLEGKPTGFGAHVGEIVYRTVVDINIFRDTISRLHEP